jgi:mono/diheme cytochrome c family protein
MITRGRRLTRSIALSCLMSISMSMSMSMSMSGCAGTPLRPTPASSPGEALFNGRIHEDVNCYKCHNGDGTGTLRGPNLAKRVPGLTDQEIVRAIEEGPSLMPSFKGKLDATEMQQLVAWLRERFPHAPQ